MNIEIVDDIESLYGMEVSWNDLTSSEGQLDYYASFSWIKSYLECTKSPPENIYTLVLTEGDSIVAIVPLSISSIKGRIFNLKSLQFIGNIYTPYWSAIYKQSMLGEIIETISRHLVEQGDDIWDVIQLKELSESDPFMFELDKALRDKKVYTCFRKMEENIQVSLREFDGAEGYFKSLKKNFRQNIRTSINRLNKDGDFEIVISHALPGSLDEIMDDYYEIYNDSWKDTEGDNEFHRKLAHTLIGDNKLRLFQLYYKPCDASNSESGDKSYVAWDGDIKESDVMPGYGYEPIASQYFILHEGNAYCLKMSYKSRYSKLGAGTVLFWYSIKYMLENDSIQKVDFQKGGERYKLQWGRLNEYRQCYLAYNPNSVRARVEYLVTFLIVPSLRRLKKLVK